MQDEFSDVSWESFSDSGDDAESFNVKQNSSCSSEAYNSSVCPNDYIRQENTTDITVSVPEIVSQEETKVSPQRTRRGAQVRKTKEELRYNINLHKVHLLCLLSRQMKLIRICCSRRLQAYCRDMLYQHLPHLQSRDSGRIPNLEESISEVMRWFRRNVHTIPYRRTSAPSKDEHRSDYTELSKSMQPQRRDVGNTQPILRYTLENSECFVSCLEPTPSRTRLFELIQDVNAARMTTTLAECTVLEFNCIFTIACRALGWYVRLVQIHDPLPVVKSKTDSQLSPIKTITCEPHRVTRPELRYVLERMSIISRQHISGEVEHLRVLGPMHTWVEILTEKFIPIPSTASQADTSETVDSTIQASGSALTKSDLADEITLSMKAADATVNTQRSRHEWMAWDVVRGLKNCAKAAHRLRPHKFPVVYVCSGNISRKHNRKQDTTPLYASNWLETKRIRTSNDTLVWFPEVITPPQCSALHEDRLIASWCSLLITIYGGLNIFLQQFAGHLGMTVEQLRQQMSGIPVTSNGENTFNRNDTETTIATVVSTNSVTHPSCEAVSYASATDTNDTSLIAQADTYNEEAINVAKSTEPIPTSITSFRKSETYCLPSLLAATQIINPQHSDKSEYIAGLFRGECIYRRTSVVELKSKRQYMQDGLQVRADELANPIKHIRKRYRGGKSNHTQPDSSPISEPPSIATLPNNRDRSYWMQYDRRISQQLSESNSSSYNLVRTESSSMASENNDVALYAPWQTEEIIVEKVSSDGRIPTNDHGNVLILHPRSLPEGSVHLEDMPLSAIKIANQLGIHAVPAVVGFETKHGRSVPTKRGIVVAEMNADTLNDAWEMQQQHNIQNEIEKRTINVIKRWEKLVRSALIAARLRRDYRSSDTNEGTRNQAKKKQRTASRHK